MTPFIKKKDIKQDWYIINAQNVAVGRLAAFISKVLRGKNKDIYFIQKRLSKEQAAIYGKEFIKKSLETTDLNEAIQKRDEILRNLEYKSFGQEKTATNDVNIVAKNDFYSTMEENMSTSIENEQNFNLNSSHNVPIDQKNNNHDANNEKLSLIHI